MRRGAAWWVLFIGCFTACGREADVYLGQDYPLESPLQNPPEKPVVEEPPAPPPLAQAGSMAEPPPAPPPSCQPELADCDGRADNGCETDLRTSALHCGACGASCPHADCACEAGKWVVRCPVGRTDCDLRLDNGCEVDLETDPLHCGACDRECHARGASVSSASCSNGSCTLTCISASPYAPRGDCDAEPDNGCEALLWADPDNCGSCGVECDFCSDGLCL